MRAFAGLSLSSGRITDETTILNFRHLPEKNGLAAEILQAVNQLLGDQNLLIRQGTIVDATLIEAPSSTKNMRPYSIKEEKCVRISPNSFGNLKDFDGYRFGNGAGVNVRHEVTGGINLDLLQVKMLLFSIITIIDFMHEVKNF